MKCDNCGTEILDNSKYCKFCGYLISNKEKIELNNDPIYRKYNALKIIGSVLIGLGLYIYVAFRVILILIYGFIDFLLYGMELTKSVIFFYFFPIITVILSGDITLMVYAFVFLILPLIVVIV